MDVRTASRLTTASGPPHSMLFAKGSRPARCSTSPPGVAPETSDTALEQMCHAGIELVGEPIVGPNQRQLRWDGDPRTGHIRFTSPCRPHRGWQYGK